MSEQAKVIASNRGWVLFERPGDPTDGWVNLWLSAKSRDINRADFLISYNLRTRRFNDCLAWKRLQTMYPAIAEWFEQKVRHRFRLKG